MVEHAAAPTAVNLEVFPPANTTAPQLTVRAVLTGMLLGALLAPCNIYSGLKIGWAFNMSISAALVSYVFWQSLHRVARTPAWGLYENNINQTAASAAASIAGSGLVAPIPALTLLTGKQFTFGMLVPWVLVVSLLGVVVAVGLRRQMLIVDKLPFPQGVATAATMREVYARGKEAVARVRMLLVGGISAAGLKLVDSYIVPLPKLAPAGSLGLRAGRLLQGAGIERVSLTSLGWVIDPSLLMLAFGVIIGPRAGLSLLFGAILAWGVVGPWALAQGWAHPGAAGGFWYGNMLEWLLWPGVSMMVAASLTSLAFSWRSVAGALSSLGGKKTEESALLKDTSAVPRSWFIGGLVIAFVLAVAAQASFFDIGVAVAGFGVLLTFLLAVVAGRVSGETGITPIGAMGKVTQLSFGLVAPGQATANLMAANVTGGAASQCADMLHDLKTGLLIGAAARWQAVAQVFGVLAGAVAGSAAYLLLVPNPQTMLLTEKWPAPAVATWKAVAEVFTRGLDTMPQGSIAAIVIAVIAGVLLAVAERLLPSRMARFIPSPASVGLAFVLPAWNAVSMCAGGLLALALRRLAPRFSDRFLIVMAGGVVAGESLAGVAASIDGVLRG